MKLDVWIEQKDSKLLTDLFELEPSQLNKITLEKQRKIVTEGISLQYRGHFVCESIDVPTWVIISIEIGKEIVLPVALGILSSYLYDKLKERKGKILINKQEVEMDAKEIEKLILANYNEENVANEAEKK